MYESKDSETEFRTRVMIKVRKEMVWRILVWTSYIRNSGKVLKKALGNRMKLSLAFSSRNYFENRIL